MVRKKYWYVIYYIMYQYFSPFPFWGHGRKTCQGSTEIWTWIAGFRVQSANHYTMELACCVCTKGNPQKSVMGAASGIKAPMRFELMISCLLYRRFNQLSHGASQWTLNVFSHNTAARRPPHPSYTQQHTTTLHNSTRVHKTTNVPVVFMALILNDSLRSCHFRAQKSLDFQGPPLPMPLVMMLHPSKSLRTAP
jgi:hypothetical protein